MRPALLLLALAGSIGCGDPLPVSERPPIEDVERRCGPSPLPALTQPRRLLALPDGRLGVAGMRRVYSDEYYDEGQHYAEGGAWVTLDPTDAAPPAVELTDSALYDAMMKGDSLYVLQDWEIPHSDKMRSRLVRRPLDAWSEATVAGDWGGWRRLSFGFGSFVAVGGERSPAQPEFVARLYSYEGREARWLPFNGPRTWYGLLMRGESKDVAWLPRTQLLVEIGSVNMPADPLDLGGASARHGYTMTRGYWTDPRWPEHPRIVSLSHKLHPQYEFEPLAMATDTAGAPWALAVEGHSGDRYRRAQPFMVRLDPETHQWTARIDPALPAVATQGALLDAVALPGGGWIVGGAACDEDREWCLAWVARLDRTGRTVWSREAARAPAMVVRDLVVDGDRIHAVIAGGQYCCQFEEIESAAWRWTLDLDGGCVASP